MHRGRFIFAAVLALATVSAQAATVVNSDFTLSNPAQAPTGWQTNGVAGLGLNPSGSGPGAYLELTHDLNSESGTAWTLVSGRVSSFTMWADVRLNFGRAFPANCPADGFTMAFAQCAPNAVGGGGGNMALFGNEEAIPRFICFEINTWRDQGLEERDACTANNKFLTFAFGNCNADTGLGRSPGENGTAADGGAKVGQVAAPATLKIINGGWYRYQWNVNAATGNMTAYITGLEASNQAVQNQKLVEVTFAAPAVDFTGRWGMTAATGGAVQTTQIAHARVDVPMVAAGAPAGD